MKSIHILLIITSLSSLIVTGKEPSSVEKWRELSAKSQNLHHQLLIIGKDTSPDPSSHKKALKDVGKALNDLVTAGHLSSRTITLISAAKIDEIAPHNFSKAMNPLIEQYGYFVAAEMCDLGARLRFVTIKPNDPVVLHLRLPKKAMEAYIARLTELKLVVEDIQEKKK